MSDLLRAVDEFAGRRVLVLGDAMLDSYLFGESSRLCQEAPVPVVAVRRRYDHPGGAANTAVNLAALGCQVELLSVVGDDGEGRRLRQLLSEHGVGTDLIAIQAGRQTLAKHRVVDGDRLLVRFDQGDTGPVGTDVERQILARLAAAFHRVDALVISDYGYGVVTDRVVGRLEALQAASQHLIAVDARDLTRYRPVSITAVKPNFEEALRLVGTSAADSVRERAQAAVAIGEIVLKRTGAKIAAITLDSDGAVVVERGQPAYRTYVERADQTRAAGAGDTYVGAFTLALTVGASTRVAADIASAAASVVVSRPGTAVCTAADLRARLQAAGVAWLASRTPASPAEPCEDETASSGERIGDGAAALADEPEERRDRDDVGTSRAPALHQT